MISFPPHIYVKADEGLAVRAESIYSFSGSGGTPKKKTKPRPIKTPKKK